MNHKRYQTPNSHIKYSEISYCYRKEKLYSIYSSFEAGSIQRIDSGIEPHPFTIDLHIHRDNGKSYFSVKGSDIKIQMQKSVLFADLVRPQNTVDAIASCPNHPTGSYRTPGKNNILHKGDTKVTENLVGAIAPRESENRQAVDISTLPEEVVTEETKMIITTQFHDIRERNTKRGLRGTDRIADRMDRIPK